MVFYVDAETLHAFIARETPGDPHNKKGGMVPSRPDSRPMRVLPQHSCGEQQCNYIDVSLYRQ